MMDGGCSFQGAECPLISDTQGRCGSRKQESLEECWIWSCHGPHKHSCEVDAFIIFTDMRGKRLREAQDMLLA